jgi:chromosome segregation ATPase
VWRPSVCAQSTEEQLAAQEKSTAEKLQLYADDAQRTLEAVVARADGLATELEWARRELVVANAGMEAARNAAAQLLHERSEGWGACEKQLREAEHERDAWRRRAAEVEAKLDATVASHQAELAAERQRHAVEMGTMLAEARLHDEDVAELRKWHTRANDLSEELGALRLAHQRLLLDSRQSDTDLRKELSDAIARYENRIAKLTKDLEEMQNGYEAMRRDAEGARVELRKKSCAFPSTPSTEPTTCTAEC